MTTLYSPIDGAPMRKVERHGVELDVCVRSGGVWLDKGEPEKIVSHVREDAMGGPRRHRYGDHGEDDDDADFDGDNRRVRTEGRRRLRLLDVFDF